MYKVELRMLKRLLVAGVVGASIMLTTSGCLVTDTGTSTISFTF